MVNACSSMHATVHRSTESAKVAARDLCTTLQVEC